MPGVNVIAFTVPNTVSLCIAFTITSVFPWSSRRSWLSSCTMFVIHTSSQFWKSVSTYTVIWCYCCNCAIDGIHLGNPVSIRCATLIFHYPVHHGLTPTNHQMFLAIPPPTPRFYFCLFFHVLAPPYSVLRPGKFGGNMRHRRML